MKINMCIPLLAFLALGFVGNVSAAQKLDKTGGNGGNGNGGSTTTDGGTTTGGTTTGGTTTGGTGGTTTGGSGTSSTGTTSPTQGNGGPKATTTSTVDSTLFIQQTGTISTTNTVILDVNGAPANTDGRDYALDGVNPNYMTEPLPAKTGYELKTVTEGTKTYLVETQVLTADQLAAGATPSLTGLRYEVTTDGYRAIMPGVSMVNITEGELTGSNSTALTGIMPDGVHNDSQVMGGISNTLSDQTLKLEALIKAVKDAANTHLDLSQKLVFSAADAAKFGTAADPKIVYATGNVRPDGTVLEGDLGFAGNFEGYGLLVMEINDPNLASLVMSGKSKWTGLVLVVSNITQTGPKNMFQTVGGGNEIHIVGGAILYSRNRVDPNNPNANLLGRSFATLSGQADVHFSFPGLNLAHSVLPSSMEVRSWRKVPEGQ
jgi:hypothetical protein